MKANSLCRGRDKRPLKAKAHSLTVHHQDQEEQKMKDRGIPIEQRYSIDINLIISSFGYDLACKAKQNKEELEKGKAICRYRLLRKSKNTSVFTFFIIRIMNDEISPNE